MNLIHKFLKTDDGQGFAEYALIIAGVSIVLIGALVAFSGGVTGVFNAIVAAF